MKIPQQDQAKTFGDWAYLAIAKHFRKVLKHEAGVLKDKDPEELHQMRVGMRRLRSATTGFALALSLPQTAEEKQVAKVAKKLGKLRDIDVLQDALQNKYKPNLPTTEQSRLEQALKALAKKRKYTFKKVKKTLNHNNYQNIKEGFQDWLKKPSYQEIAEISIQKVLPDLLLPQVSKLLLHPGWLVGVKLEAANIILPDQLNPEEVEQLLESKGELLHSLRKEAKRSRYNLELFTQLYEDDYHKHVKQIKEVQEVLGQIQDCFVLAEFLTEVFESDLKSQVPTLATQLTKTRYQKWQDWEALQRQFLNSQTRQDLRMSVQQPSF